MGGGMEEDQTRMTHRLLKAEGQPSVVGLFAVELVESARLELLVGRDGGAGLGALGPVGRVAQPLLAPRKDDASGRITLGQKRAVLERRQRFGEARTDGQPVRQRPIAAEGEERGHGLPFGAAREFGRRFESRLAAEVLEEGRVVALGRVVGAT